MTTEADLPIEQRIVRLLHHMGIEKAHFAAKVDGDWLNLATNHPEAIASLTLVCPPTLDTDILGPMADRLLVISGDQTEEDNLVRAFVKSLPGASQAVLSGYSGILWADVMSERRDEAGSAMLGFLRGQPSIDAVRAVGDEDDEASGIIYRASGSGAPLVLLPMGLSPSQWDPVIPALSRDYRTIVLGGPNVSSAASLDRRGRMAGFARLVQSLINDIALRPGETVLDLGCGSGVHDRWLARQTGGANPITAADHSPYILREASALAKSEGLDGIIEFREANAEALPFEDGSFDVAITCTVMEEVNADRMLSEMVRVTRPGGRVGVIVRAVDMHYGVNAPLPAKLRARIESPGGALSDGGCADASLYRRFVDSGLDEVRMLPHTATFRDPVPLHPQGLTARVNALGADDKLEWDAAVAKARAEGTFFTTQPFHCAIGTKR